MIPTVIVVTSGSQLLAVYGVYIDSESLERDLAKLPLAEEKIEVIALSELPTIGES